MECEVCESSFQVTSGTEGNGGESWRKHSSVVCAHMETEGKEIDEGALGVNSAVDLKGTAKTVSQSSAHKTAPRLPLRMPLEQ